MPFETYQLVGNEDHTLGCRRTGNRIGAPACKSQQWLSVTALPDQTEMFWHHKFPLKTAKTPLTGHRAIASGTHQAYRLHLHYPTPKVGFWLRGTIYNLFCECWLASCWLIMQGLGVTIIRKEILALLRQRVLAEVLFSQVKHCRVVQQQLRKSRNTGFVDKRKPSPMCFVR